MHKPSTLAAVAMIVCMAIAVAGCVAPGPPGKPTPSPHPVPSPEGTEPPADPATVPAAARSQAESSCGLAPIVVPTMPATRPGYAELDTTTGLHVTGRAREIDLESYQIEVSGLVETRLWLSYDDLRCMPRIEDNPLLVCPGFFEDQAGWAGASLEHILDLAGVQEGASWVRLVGSDRYEATVTIKQARSTGAFLAYEWEGDPLPILHGFPVRAVFPTLEGNKWVKWVVKIEVS